MSLSTIDVPKSVERHEDVSPLQREIGSRIIRVLGAGANTQHSSEAFAALREAGFHVQLFDTRDIAPEDRIPHDEFYNLSDANPEVQEEITRALGEKALSLLLSLPPHVHKDALIQSLRGVALGKVGVVVVPKPYVQTREEALLVQGALEMAEGMRRDRLGEDYYERPLILIHEHYGVKGPEEALNRMMPEVINILGRPVGMTYDIQELQRLEDEGRTLAAIGSGAFDDLATHGMYSIQELERAIRESEHFVISSDLEHSLRRYQYVDTDLPEHVETGFKMEYRRQIIDKRTGKEYPLPITMRGGKGLASKKTKVVYFASLDDSGLPKKVIVDFDARTLQVPTEVAHLFEHFQFVDNGYGDVMLRTLSGRDLMSLQSTDSAFDVVALNETIKEQARHDDVPVVKYTRTGHGLEEVEARLLAATVPTKLVA